MHINLVWSSLYFCRKCCHDPWLKETYCCENSCYDTMANQDVMLVDIFESAYNTVAYKKKNLWNLQFLLEYSSNIVANSYASAYMLIPSITEVWKTHKINITHTIAKRPSEENERGRKRKQLNITWNMKIKV